MNKEDIKILLIIMSMIIGVIVVLITEIYLIQKYIHCPQYAKSVNLEYKYNFLAGGCFVNYQGQWIPSDNLRAGKLN